MHRECTGGLKSLLSVHFLMTRWDQVYLSKGGSLRLAAEDQPEYLVLKQAKQLLCSAQTACGFLLTEGLGRVSSSWCTDASWAPHKFHCAGFCSSKSRDPPSPSLLHSECLCQHGRELWMYSHDECHWRELRYIRD